MRKFNETIDQSWTFRRKSNARHPVPGLLLLFTDGKASLRALPLVDGVLTLGRSEAGIDDARMSRQHAEARFDGKIWRIRDLGSRNGTFVDGVQVTGEHSGEEARVVRTGGSLFGLLSDVRAFENAVVEHRDGVVAGPTLRRTWDEIARAAENGDSLHVTGESGSGKELAARHFHRSSPRASGPFVAVNCAAIPPNLAERLLFGAKKGAYSGADADADGYVQAAHGGTLFLDEIAELEQAVQAKLLRVLESREVLALGSSKPRKVEIGLVSATHQDLRALSASGKFRHDLFFRIARPHVSLPRLRDRLEDIPWLIDAELAKVSKLGAHVSLVEACLLRPWPGNVRELAVEIRNAASAAEKAKSARVEAHHLAEHAGLSLDETAPEETEAPEPSAEQIAEALKREGGNVTRAARALGWHRNQLRRWLAKHMPSTPTE
jgi:transcriptional regulator with PAS, ATPase and Fis domain